MIFKVDVLIVNFDRFDGQQPSQMHNRIRMWLLTIKTFQQSITIHIRKGY